MKVKRKLLKVFAVSAIMSLAGLSVRAQAPQQFNYQGALRNADGSAVSNKNITLRLSVLDGSEQGLLQYAETRSLTTTSLGMYSVSIGGLGASSKVNVFSAITWASGLKYLKVEVDVNGGNNFVTAGTTQLLSVPYALFAANGGASGKSAYQIWLDSGKTGSEADFLESLKLGAQTASGDLSGNFPSPQVIKIQGIPISSAAPTSGQILRYDGSSWSPTSFSGVVGADVTTTQPDVLEVSNGTGAALKGLGLSIKPGNPGSYLVTDQNNNVKWQTAVDAKLVSGSLATFTFGKLDDGTSDIPANNVGKIKINVAGAQAGNPVFVTPVGDETEYQVLASWVSAPNEISLRLANYQPVPVNITGRQYKVLLIQN